MKIDDLRPKLEALTPDELDAIAKEVHALRQAKADLEEIRFYASEFTNPHPKPVREKGEKAEAFAGRLDAWRKTYSIQELDPAIRALALACARAGRRLVVLNGDEEEQYHGDD